MRKEHNQAVRSFVLSAVVLFVLCTLAGFAQARESNQNFQGDIFWIRGGPVDAPAPHYRDLEVAIRSTVQQSGLPVRMTFRHNLADGGLCRLITRERRDQGRRDKLILVGHSWGAAFLVRLSKCLETAGVTIDTLIMMDAIQRPFEPAPDEVPSNVVRVYNWYQTQDPVLVGENPVLRSNGTVDGVFPELILVGNGSGSVVDAHNKMVNRVLDTGLLQTVISQSLQP